MKKTWSTINEVLNKGKGKKEFPKYFNVNNSSVENNAEIADAFNDFFANIGIRFP